MTPPVAVNRYRGWTIDFDYGYYSATGPGYEPSGVDEDGRLYNTVDDQHVGGCRTLGDLLLEIDAWIKEHP